MCGRFTLTWDEWRRVADGLGIYDEGDAAASYRPRFNIAPTDQHFIITSEFERRKAKRARWGLVNRWAKDNSRASQCINAKAETLEQRTSFREAFQQHRCVVPADGWYEWTGSKSKRQPLWIHPKDGGLMLFAGLYESWYPARNQLEMTFTIVTCAANATVAAIHNRMPVILDEGGAEDWMNPGEENLVSLKRLLVPAPADLLVMQPASPRANSVKNEGPELLQADGQSFALRS
ncbi:MAG TPA: SOS response-associated peptidase [Candidatus Binataceae bacterium]|nr:SOS response-associated peptidase [Candidatus Binataceae bacterium]